jgi:hypothetical protein
MLTSYIFTVWLPSVNTGRSPISSIRAPKVQLFYPTTLVDIYLALVSSMRDSNHCPFIHTPAAKLESGQCKCKVYSDWLM